MFSSTLIGNTKRLLLIALALAALAAPTAGAASPCRTGNAPLQGGASTSTRSGAGLVARGWDAWTVDEASCKA
jgi:hypothetical protein